MNVEFCDVVEDGRHPAGVVVARWHFGGLHLCNFHCENAFPDVFRTVTDPAAVDAELEPRRRRRARRAARVLGEGFVIFLAWAWVWTLLCTPVAGRIPQ